MDFRAYFGPFSLVKRAKNKIAILQQKKCSNKKSEENKPTLKFNFKCASLYFQFWVLVANLDEPYCTSRLRASPKAQPQSIHLRYPTGRTCCKEMLSNQTCYSVKSTHQIFYLFTCVFPEAEADILQ